MMENCPHHKAIEVELERCVTHCNESDRPGGVRDKVTVMEEAIKQHRIDFIAIKEEMKKAILRSGITGGVIGGLIGTQSSEIITWAFKKLLGG